MLLVLIVNCSVKTRVHSEQVVSVVPAIRSVCVCGCVVGVSGGRGGGGGGALCVDFFALSVCLSVSLSLMHTLF